MDLRLYDGVREGSVDLFKKLANENPDLLLQVTRQLENTVLHLAAKVGHEGLVKEACEKCQSLLAKTNSKGDTALHIAARAGHLSVVKILVEKSISGSTSIDVEKGGIQTNNILRIQNEGNNTVLHEALRYGHSEVAKVLTEKDPELWCVVNEAGESPLYLAAKGGLTEIVGQVLQSSHPYAHGGPNSLTALHAAAIWDEYDITELLVKTKPELITEKDIHGKTALHYAASYGRIGVAGLLLESDTSVVYIQDKDGRSPIHFAAGNGNYGTTYEILERYPDAVDLVDSRGQNAIHVCIANYQQDRFWAHERVIRYFMRRVWHEDLINQADNEGNTPLHLAFIRQCPELVSSMLKNQDRLLSGAMNKDKLTPLDLAISGKHRAAESKIKGWSPHPK